MVTRLSAPVGDKKRITKLDLKKKSQKFAVVANKPADVELVQLMLDANGYPTVVDGKDSGGLIQTIRSFQKSKCGFKTPDGIVDPGMQTWQAGAAKLNARLKALEKIEVYEVRENGKTRFISKKDFEEKQAKLLRVARIKADGMHSMCQFWLDELKEADQVLQGADTFMMSLVEFSVRTVNSNAKPPYKPMLNARSDASYFKALTNTSKLDWIKIQKQENKAVKSYNEAQQAWNTYINARIGTAGNMAKGAEIVSELSFGVVEAYATGYLVITRGMPPAKANAIASAGTTALKSSSMQVGNYLAGNKTDWGKVVTDTAFAGAAGFVGGKVGTAFVNGAATKMAKSLSRKFSSRLSQKTIDLFFNKFLATGPGQGLIENSAKEAINQFKVMVQSGKAPTQKQMEEAIIKIMIASALNSPASKSLSAWDVKVPKKTQEFVENTLTPKTLEGVKKSLAREYGKDLIEDVTSSIRKELDAKVLKGMGTKSVEIAVLYVVDRLDGEQTESQLNKLSNEGLRSNVKFRRELQALIEAEIREETEKREKSK